MIFDFSEVSYPEDEVVAQEVPSDVAVVEAIQPEAVISVPTPIPQIDRTRKPINNQKPESPVIEQQEFPIKPVIISSILFIEMFSSFSYDRHKKNNNNKKKNHKFPIDRSNLQAHLPPLVKR